MIHSRRNERLGRLDWGWCGRVGAGVAASCLLLLVLCCPALAFSPAGAGARGPDVVYTSFGRCEVPIGAKVLASNRWAVVFAVGLPYPPYFASQSIPFYGCLRSVGNNWVLERAEGSVDGAFYVSSASLFIGDAVLIYSWEDQHYGGQWSIVEVFNLANGRIEPEIGGERTTCTPFPDALTAFGCPTGGIDAVLVGEYGVSAVHIRYVTGNTSIEQIQVSDEDGVYDIDSGTFTGKGPFLTDLKFTGDTLSWNHDGTPRSTFLFPLLSSQ